MDLNYLENYSQVIGCDEVGRGPIAGPVNACAVSVNKDSVSLIDFFTKLNITDSKKLSTKKRLNILEVLNIKLDEIKIGDIHTIESEGGSFKFVVEELSPEKIDEINILQASLLCMKNASDKLVEKNTKILIDGNKKFDSLAETEAIVKGDSKSCIIALASIIAKEYRDKLMKEFAEIYPGYGLESHAGYPTVKHKEAVINLGVTPIHRKSFRGVKEYV